MDLYITSNTKINSKYIINLNVRAKTTKLFKENTGVNLSDLGLDRDFLDMTPKPQVIKEKSDTLDFVNITNFCISKDTIKKVKIQLIDWEKHLQIIYNIRDLYVELKKKNRLQLKNKNTNIPNSFYRLALPDCQFHCDIWF